MGYHKPTKLSSRDQLFMCLFMLRTGSTLRTTASLFGLGSTTTATSYFVTWVRSQHLCVSTLDLT